MMYSLGKADGSAEIEGYDQPKMFYIWGFQRGYISYASPRQ
jgi:hypothetical protein